jgi:hypothetical protein
MARSGIDLDAPIYTAKDVIVCLSHLADWYRIERTGPKDFLLHLPHLLLQIQKLHVARTVRGYNGQYEEEFSRLEAYHMFRRLKRRYVKVGRENLVIRPERLVAAMRALKTREKNRSEKRAT